MPNPFAATGAAVLLLVTDVPGLHRGPTRRQSRDVPCRTWDSRRMLHGAW